MLSDGEISYLYDGFGRFEQVTKADGSITHVINGEEKESGELPQEDVQSRVLNYYEYDAFGNTIRCEEQVHNRFRYTGEQYDILTGQYYLRARYYNPVIARFTQEDTYYGDGLNLYTYCQNNPILNHDPTGHGTKENSPYSRKEQQYIDAGADPDTARLAAQCYPDAKSKQDLYNKYKKQGYSAQDAKKLANREIIHGEEATKKYIKDNNVKKSGPDYTATSPRDNVNTDWRTQERLNAQRNAGAGKGNESGNKSGSNTVYSYDGVKQASEYLQSQGVPRAYRKQILESFDVETIKLQTAGESTYGLRFYGGNANAEGRYLFETFSPLTNRQNLALPYEWNSMTGIQQFQVRNGTTMITGKAAAQKRFGSQYIGGANQWYINNLEDLIKCR
jgi:RHS repeat-associated protein